MFFILLISPSVLINGEKDQEKYHFHQNKCDIKFTQHHSLFQ